MPANSSVPESPTDIYLTDGGLETTLIFRQGLELPHFASVMLLATDAGTAALADYFRTYAEIALRLGVGCLLETATWRASADWGARLGCSLAALAALNRRAVEILIQLREREWRGAGRWLVSGNIGPRGDGYRADRRMTASEAAQYHLGQAQVLADSGADLITGMTINYSEEAIGIVRAAMSCHVPAVISLTVETDGRLPTGQALCQAIAEIDEATDSYSSYYMVNCAHPAHIVPALADAIAVKTRVGGLRPNASRLSHAELDASTDLDDGNPAELAAECRSLGSLLPNLRVLGGCCGTDERHVEAIVRAWLQPT